MKFATIDTITARRLFEVKIDRFCISKESMDKVTEILELDGKDAEELTAIRNGIVKFFSEMANDAREENDWDEFDEFRTKQSGIVAVIDNKLFEMGALY